MELKLLRVDKDPNGNFCFNRTFMELKSVTFGGQTARNGSFNRTFMELKSSLAFCVLPTLAVLIVPLWN